MVFEQADSAFLKPGDSSVAHNSNLNFANVVGPGGSFEIPQAASTASSFLPAGSVDSGFISFAPNSASPNVWGRSDLGSSSDNGGWDHFADGQRMGGNQDGDRDKGPWGQSEGWGDKVHNASAESVPSNSQPGAESSEQQALAGALDQLNKLIRGLGQEDPQLTAALTKLEGQFAGNANTTTPTTGDVSTANQTGTVSTPTDVSTANQTGTASTPSDVSTANQTGTASTPSDVSTANQTGAVSTPTDVSTANQTGTASTPTDVSTANQTGAVSTPSDVSTANQTGAVSTPSDVSTANQTGAVSTPTEVTTPNQTTESTTGNGMTLSPELQQIVNQMGLTALVSGPVVDNVTGYGGQGATAEPLSAYGSPDGNGGFTITNDPSTWGGDLTNALTATGTQVFVADVTFNPNSLGTPTWDGGNMTSWPAVWANSGVSPGSTRMQEDDMMEYFSNINSPPAASTLHDWNTSTGADTVVGSTQIPTNLFANAATTGVEVAAVVNAQNDTITNYVNGQQVASFNVNADDPALTTPMNWLMGTGNGEPLDVTNMALYTPGNSSQT